MEGLGIQHPDEIPQDFQQNLSHKIHRQTQSTLDKHLPAIMQCPLEKANRPTLVVHVRCLEPKQWALSDNRLQPLNRLLSLHFHAVALLVIAYKSAKDS
jgi:hypothetical protein